MRGLDNSQIAVRLKGYPVTPDVFFLRLAEELRQAFEFYRTGRDLAAHACANLAGSGNAIVSRQSRDVE
jgi:hypothetical protein